MNIETNYLNKSGIYCITNIVNNKIYIGSSINIYYRLHQHKSTLLKNKHRNILLQRSFNKYGRSNFKCEILELCSNENLLIREQYYIDTLNPEFNLTRLVERNELSEESKIKISNTLKEKYKIGEIEGTIKAIDVYDLKGNFIKSYKSCIECSKDLKISQHSISDVLSGKYQQNCGYIFVEKGQLPNINFKSKKGVKVYIIDDKNKITEYRSFSEAAKNLNIKVSILHRAYKTKGKYKNYKITTDVPV